MYYFVSRRALAVSQRKSHAPFKYPSCRAHSDGRIFTALGHYSGSVELKMADGENIVVGAKTRTPESDEPVLKKPRMGISVECGLQIVEKDQGMCRTETEENWAAATPARSAEEVEPAMAVGQATETLGGDNGLLVPQHGENVLGIERTSVPGQDEGLAGSVLSSYLPFKFWRTWAISAVHAFCIPPENVGFPAVRLLAICNKLSNCTLAKWCCVFS